METKTAAVSMRNVTKTFGSVVANDKISLDIYKGEILKGAKAPAKKEGGKQ